MSDANETTPVSDAHEPHIKVLKGNPTAEELAALIGVLSAAGGGPVDTTPAAVDLWGHPVDRLRYTVHSWQRITLLERQHMRR